MKKEWDQSAFERMKATWTPERIEEDEKRLQELFKLAEYSQTMRDALDWAEQNGIKFFIDRKAVNCGG